MFGDQEIEALERRKLELVERSARQRAQLEADVQKLQPVLSWIETGSRLARQAGPLVIAASPVLGWWLARKEKGGGLFSKLTRAASLFQSARSLLRAFRSPTRPAPTSTTDEL